MERTDGGSAALRLVSVRNMTDQEGSRFVIGALLGKPTWRSEELRTVLTVEQVGRKLGALLDAALDVVATADTSSDGCDCGDPSCEAKHKLKSALGKLGWS